jgi:bifunctional DNA-binding transcriptional regulator/antitoxin component of YhaV-PrlF toxin-antitoxin module
MKTQIVNGFGDPGKVREYRDIKITTKRQLTIPKAFFDYLGIEETVHAYLLDDAILIKPAQKKSVQEMDIEKIVRNVMNEGYSGDDMAEEIAYRIKQYNEHVERRINEFLNDMTSEEVEDDQGDVEFNGLDIFFDEENGEIAEANQEKRS